MKRICSYIIILFPILQSQAQTYPLTGATLYLSENSFGNPQKDIQWTFLNDSLSGNNRYLKFKTRTVSILTDPISQANTYYDELGAFNLIERNDSVFYETPIQGRTFICDFNLVTGDSTISPFYHDFINSAYYSSNCYNQNPNGTFHQKVDSFMLFQKAYVIDHNTEVINGHSFKYYTIEFKLLNPLDINTFNNPVLKQLTFHQRSIFSVGATSVPWESFHVCDYGLDDSYVINQIKCFNDELSNSTECDSEENYFTYFSLDENKINSTIDIYPNPVENDLSIQYHSSNNTLTGFISDLSGRKQGVHFTLSPESNTIVPLSHLKSGMYILVLTDQEGNTQTHKVIKK